MAEEIIPKKTGAERQAEILVSALERAAQNDGVLLNSGGKLAPHFYGKEARITPANALIMAMHSDQGSFRTNAYTMYRDTQARDEAVRKGQKGVPFVWTNTNQYVHNDNPENVISRAQFNELPNSDKVQYKPNHREDVYTVFNIDQTTMSSTHKEDYNQHIATHGDATARSFDQNDDKAMRIKFNDFLLNVKENLVPLRKDASGVAYFDSGKDMLHIPAQKNFPTYGEYAQEVTRQIVIATGTPQRLGRVAGVAARRPTEQQLQREALVVELASAHRVLEMGLPAKVSENTKQILPGIIYQLKNDPTFAEKVLHDVNSAVGMMKKAENGEKIVLIEKPSEERQQVWAAQFPIDNAPEKFSHIFMLKDDEGAWTLVAKPENGRTFATHPTKEDVSLYFDVMKNDNDEAHVREFRTMYAQKYYAAVAENPTLAVNVFKSGASAEALALVSKVNAFKTKDEKMMMVATIGDDRQKAVEINASQWQLLWLADDKNDFKTHLAATLYKDIIDEKLNGNSQRVSASQEFDARKALNEAMASIEGKKPVEMEVTSVVRNDANEWTLLLKPQEQNGFGIQSDSKDLHLFFATVKNGEPEETDKVKNYLATKYMEVAEKNPSLKQELFYGDVSKEDKDRITHATIFRTKEDKLMLMPNIEGLGKQRPREITQSQWQRLWLADDMADYKKGLAATVFADVLHQTQTKTQTQTQAGNFSQTRDAKEIPFPHLDSYDNLKAKHPDAVLLFRTDDKYESYKQDAEICAKVLGIEKQERVNSKTGESVVMTEFPFHQLDTYLPKLVRSGNRVAICDQLQPSQTQSQTQTQSDSQAQSQEQSKQNETQRGMRR